MGNLSVTRNVRNWTLLNGFGFRKHISVASRWKYSSEFPHLTSILAADSWTFSVQLLSEVVAEQPEFVLILLCIAGKV